MSRKIYRNDGFTLIEVLIYIALFVLILSSIYGVFESNRSTYASGDRKADVQQNARVGMDEMARQIRMAGYFPENFDTNTGNNIANGAAVHLATNSAIAVFGDVDGAGVSNVVLFCLDGTVLRRGSAAASAAAYTCSNGQILAENITSLRFTYYDGVSTPIPNPPTTPYQLDGQNTGAIPSFSTTTQRAAVRRVVITLTVREDVPRRAPQIYSLTSDVRLRNVN